MHEIPNPIPPRKPNEYQSGIERFLAMPSFGFLGNYVALFDPLESEERDERQEMLVSMFDDVRSSLGVPIPRLNHDNPNEFIGDLYYEIETDRDGSTIVLSTQGESNVKDFLTIDSNGYPIRYQYTPEYGNGSKALVQYQYDDRGRLIKRLTMLIENHYASLAINEEFEYGQSDDHIRMRISEVILDDPNLGEVINSKLIAVVDLNEPEKSANDILDRMETKFSSPIDVTKLAGILEEGPLDPESKKIPLSLESEVNPMALKYTIVEENPDNKTLRIFINHTRNWGYFLINFEQMRISLKLEIDVPTLVRNIGEAIGQISESDDSLRITLSDSERIFLVIPIMGEASIINSLNGIGYNHGQIWGRLAEEPYLFPTIEIPDEPTPYIEFAELSGLEVGAKLKQSLGIE